ncbi:hypothetical protein CL629_01835 [bacterium]|nr:hypothetical protein [bacterium]|tara:strand:+ start:427 stop:627 length:201 start_codon:yes stop_codon:yes gene_type:complete
MPTWFWIIVAAAVILGHFLIGWAIARRSQSQTRKEHGYNSRLNWFIIGLWPILFITLATSNKDFLD